MPTPVSGSGHGFASHAVIALALAVLAVSGCGHSTAVHNADAERFITAVRRARRSCAFLSFYHARGGRKTDDNVHLRLRKILRQ